MSHKVVSNEKDTTILAASDYNRILMRAKRPEADHSLDEERNRQLKNHEQMQKATETWSNSIVNERKDRISRLRVEADQKEEKLKEEDEKERVFQKELRKKKLEGASELGLLQQSEIRAVNSQLLLHEVTKERQHQIQIHEQQKERDLERQQKYEEEEKQRLKEALEKEKEEKQKRRQKAIETANFFIKQKEEADQKKKATHNEEAQDEALLAQEAKRLISEEKLAELKKRELERKHRDEMVSRNADLVKFKQREKDIEDEEQRRIDSQRVALIDEQEKRAEADKKRKEERQSKIDALIEKGAKNLEKIKSQQSQFEKAQEDIQFEKEKKAIEDETAKQQRMTEERRNDFLDAQKKIEAQKKKPKKKEVFPTMTESRDVAADYDGKKNEGLKEIAEFQRQQIIEKKEKEAALKERERLEFLNSIEAEDIRTDEAQKYAKSMLSTVKGRF